MAENRFLHSLLNETEKDATSLEIPYPTTRTAPDSTVQDVRQPAQAMRGGLMPPPNLQPMFEAAAAQYGVPINVLSALAQQESNYNPGAIGSMTKWGRAKGLMQNIDPTAQALGINPFNAEESIFAAAKQMRERMDKGDSMEDVVKAHFGGDNRKQWGEKTRRYGVEVLDKADRIGQDMLAQKPAEAEQGAQAFDIKAVQAEMDAKEPGRYQVLDPEEVAARQSKRRDIASGHNAIGNAMESLQGDQRLQTYSPLPVAEQIAAQQSFKEGGKPITPLTIENQIRANKRMPLRDTSFDHLRDESGAIVSYLKRSAISGLYDLAGAGAKVLDAVNPWTFTEADIATIYKDQPGKYQEYLDNSAGMILNRFAKAMTKKSEDSMRLISPEASAEYGDLKYATTDMGKSALAHPTKVIGDAVRSLPSTVALAVTAYVTRGAAQRAEAQALAAGAAPEVAKQVGIQAGMKTMAQVGATSEGAIGYAQQANQTWAEANKAAIEKSPRYQGLLQEGYTPETARAKIVADTSEESGKYAGIVDASVNLVGGQFLGKIISEGGSFIPRVMKGFGNEAATETVQGAGEKFGENLATKNNIDPNQSLSEGTGEAAVQGMAVGGLTGGVVSGAIGARSEPTAQKERIEPTLGDVVDPTATPGSTQDATTPAAQAATTPAATVPTEITPAPVAAPAEAPPAGPLTRAAEAAIPPQAVLPENMPATAEAEQPAGEPVTVRSNDGELPGTLESYEEDGQGNWSARVMAEDGNAYEFTQADGVSLDRAAAPTVEGPKLSEVENAQQESTTPASAANGTETEVPGNSNAAGANRTEAQLRAELKAVAAELRTDRTNADLKARRKAIEQEINRLTSAQPEAAANAERADGTTEAVPDRGLTIVHGSGNPSMRADDIQIVRTTGQKQGKAGRVYGGFYGTSEADVAQAEGYAGMMGGTSTVYDVKVKPGTKVLNKTGDVTRLSEKYINELTTQGYGLVVGKDPRGRTEYVVIDKAAIDTVAARKPARQAEPAASEALSGEKINRAWTKFAPASGTLNIPRAEMPQIKAEHRGAMVNFLNARGIVSTQEEVPASSLKPTQQEFSPAKVKKAKAFKGGDRSILVSSDGHVVDGHHQWMAKLDANEPIKVIRLDAPISQLLEQVKEFPSSTQANGSTTPKVEPTNSLSRTASWAIRNKETGEVVMETFDQKKVEALNTDTYEAVPIQQHLAEVNQAVRDGDPTGAIKPKQQPEPPTPQPPAKEGAPAEPREFKTPKQKALERKVLIQRKAREQVGVEEGEQFTMSGDVGYATGGRTYTLESINTDGSVEVSSDRGRTSLSRAELQGAKNRGVTFNRVEKPAVKTELNPAPVSFNGREIGKDEEFYRTKEYEQIIERQNKLDEIMGQIEDGDYTGPLSRGDVRKAIRATEYNVQSLASEFTGIADGLAAWREVNRQLQESTPAKSEKPAAEPAKAKPEVSKNVLVSDERAAELRQRLKGKLTQLNSGIDPEIVAIGTELAVYHIERGARTFAAYAKAIADDLGTTVQALRPYLRSWYNGSRDMMEDGGHSIDGMDSPDTVRTELAKLANPGSAPTGEAAETKASSPKKADPAPTVQTVTTPAGREFEVRTKVVEADSLTTSNNADGSVNPDYPQELQPRDRGRSASLDQINDIASKLNPRLLGESASATDGAPIVSPGGVVESGNGRTLSIQQAYSRHPEVAAKYRAWIKAQGFDVEGMKAPMLVRERVTPMDTAELQAYTSEANERTTLAMSSTERAMADAKKIGGILHLYRGGDVQGAANREFVRGFMSDVAGKSDRGTMMDGDGMLSQEGRRRIEAALLAAAYGDANIVTDLFESGESDIKSIGGALLDASGEWALMRQEARDGTIPAGVDTTPHLMEAVNLVRRARAEGRPIFELVNQSDIFAGDLSQATKAFVSVFYRGDSLSRARGRDKVADALLSYTQQARAAQPGNNLFGDPEVSGSDLLRGVNEKLQRQEDNSGQGSLFGGQRDPAERAGEPGREGQRPRTGAEGEGSQAEGDGYKVDFAGWVAGAGPKGTQKQEITMRSPKGDRAGRINLYREPSGDYDLSDIWVSEDHRRKGVATRMLDAVFRDTGAPFIRLSTGTTGDGTALTENYGETKIDGRRVIERPARLGEAGNAPDSRSGVERDRPDAGTAQSVVQDPTGDAAGQADGSARDAGEGARAERDAGQRDQRLPDDGAPAGRARGDHLVHQPDGQFRPESGTSGSAERTGSGSDSVPGTAVEQERAGDIVADAPAADASDFTRRLEAQRKADKAPTKRGDKASIDAALPLLLPAQRDDVLKAEQRHAEGNGMLHTNGTGTGKTASGLGLAKRFINDGKDDIIIVVPSDKISSDWVKFASMMGIELKQLADTKDNGGKGPVITTYANFAANDSLAQRNWDLAITDESHYLSSNEAGETTGALEQLRALTGHHSGFYKAVRDQNPKAYAALQAAIAARPTQEQMLNYSPAEQAAFDKAIEDARAKWDAIEKPARKAWEERWAKQEGLPKTLFLSATPFPYVKNVDYAEGYLFDYVKPSDLKKSEGRSGGYNSGSPRDQFLMQHFGYRMRTNKLTAPEAGVDSELMEQNFNQWLKDTGALSGRRLEVPFDYDRKFAMVEDAVGQKIDQGLKYLREEGDGKYRKVYDAVMAGFDYQSRMYLLESIKARAVIPMIKEHLALGRKVVVFHDYNKGGGFDPFKASMPDEETRTLAREAFAARPDLFKLKLTGLNSPIETIGAAFDDVLFFNGTVPKKKRRENADAFNNDNGDNHLMVVQSDAGREGVSLHDTTGKHQRVLINLGMPGKPVAAIQIEGRTYRTGQASDAVFRYLTTGTAWEASAFASKIAERASTAENLALGTDARGLKQSFIDSYNDADLAPASAEDGKGGKAYDRDMASGQQLTGFTKAKTFYYAQQKNTRRRDQREGVDYFATPEPVGFKMAEWANIQQGDKVLEPSAGHGAIARFFPDRTDVTMVEPSYELSQRAALANGTARIVNERFEDLHISNKYDAVVMNPPYGSGGKTAIEHVSKAAKHLRDGGRIVALIPRGGITGKRLEAFLGSEDAADLHLVAKIDMPASTFERAGTAVSTQVLVLEKHVNPDDATGIQQRNIDLSNAENIGELFDRIEEIGMPDRIPSSKPEPKEEIVEHTTGKGKVLRGVIRTGLTRDQAKEIDPFTFKKGDGYFIRAKYLDQGKQSVDAYRGFSLDVDGAKFSVQPDGLRSLVEAEPLDLAVAPELAARPLAEVRAEAFGNMLANRSTTMTHPSVGTITFNRAGITKSRSTSNDPAKVLTMSNLDEIVSEAAYLGRSEPEGDAGNVARYHYLGRRLNVDGEPMVAMITLRENADGRISYYNHSMLQDAPTIESVTAPQAANDNAKYQRPALRMERLSLSDGATATPGQADRIRETLTTGTIGKGIARLIDSGRIVLHDTVRTVPGKALPGTQAMTMPDGTVHLVAENLTPQTAIPVMLHEMFHSGGESLVGSKRWGELQGRLASLHRQFSKSPGKAGEFYAAAQRVADAKRAGNTMSEGLTVEEFGAYAIENYESAPATIRKWADDVIGAIKEFMFRTFGIQLGQVSPSQLRAMAVEAIRTEAMGARDAIAASMTGAAPTAAELSSQLKQAYPGLKLDLMGAGQRVTLSRIVLPEAGRNAGVGSSVMQRITAWADQTGTTVALTPSSDFGGNKSRLTEFYKRFGFVENKGRNRDYEISETMFREPSGAEIRYSLKPSKVFKDLTAEQKTFLDKIGPERLPQRLKDRWSQLTDNLGLRIRQAGVDRYAALLRNDKALLGEDTLEGSIASSAWVLARMSPSAGGAVSALLNNGRIYLDAKEKVIDIKDDTKGLADTLRKLGSPVEIDRFMGWIAANRSKRLLGEGKENLFTPEEIEAGIKLSGGKLENGKSRSILYAQAWKEFQQHRDDVLGIAQDTGIITPEQRDTWSEEFYVPFYRVMDEDTVGGPSSGSGISRQQAYKKLKGGKQNLNDLLDNTLLNFHHLLQASLKNQASAQAMVNAEKLGIAERTTENKRDKKMSTFVMVDGEKQWFNVSDALTFKAVSSLADAGLNNPVMRVGRAFKRFFTNMTTITPQFVVANAIRDTLAAMATSPTSMIPLKTAFKGALTYGNDSNKARMMASGGAFSFGHVYGQNANEIKASLSSSMRTAQVLSDPKLIPNVLLGAWRKYHAVTDFAENINRAGIWEHNKDRGKLKAAFEARDLMDFSAHGDAAIVRIMTDLVPFLNARIQGLDKLYRAGGKPAIKTLFGKGSKSDKQSFARFVAVVGALTAVSALLYLRNKDDEDYRKLEDWQRDSYWVIKIGDGMYFIPKPFEVGAIATMGERLLEQFVDPTVGGEKLASRMGHMLTDTFAFNPIPQVVKPLYELGANENTFTGRPIEDQSMQRLSPSLRSRPETSRLADAASRGIETSLDLVGGKQLALSPVQIDHLIQGYAGAVGAGAVGLADTIWRRASGEELPARRWSEYQPIKRFYKDLTLEDNYTRYGTDFYNALKKADQAYADMQHLVKYGQEERAAAVEEKQGDELAMRGTLTKVNRTMSRINAEMKRIQMDKGMSSEAKRLELDRMRSMRNLITEEIGKDLEKEKVLKRRGAGKQ